MTDFKLTRMQTLSTIFAVLAVMLLLQVILLPAKGQALVLNPDPGNDPHTGIPPDYRNHLMTCDAQNPMYSPAFVSFLRHPGGFSNVYTPTAGEQSSGQINMSFNLGAAVCASNSAVLENRHLVAGARAYNADTGDLIGSISGGVGGQSQLNFQPNYNQVGKYVSTPPVVFTYNHGGPITGAVNIRIALDLQAINYFTNGQYLCVPAPAGNRGGWDFASCAVNTTELYIRLTPDTVQTVIQGRLANKNDNTPIPNVTVDLCNGRSAVSDADGVFQLAVPYNTPFCVRAPAVAGYSAIEMHPFAEGYANCPAGGYCNETYEYQYTGGDFDGPWRGVGGDGNGIDRASDGGYDFVYIPIPPLIFDCSFSVSGSMIEVGTPFALTVTIRNASSALAPTMNDSTHPVAISATPASVAGLGPASEYAYSAAPGTTVTVTDNGLTIQTPATYTFQVTVGGEVCNGSSISVGTFPYLKTYGGDVRAGGTWGYINPDCMPADGRGGVYAFARPVSSGVYAGASAQLTVSSLLEINQFYSASQRSNRPVAQGGTNMPKGLTFANTDSDTYGGNNTGGHFCITDYFTDTRDPSLGSGAFNGSFASGRVQYVNSGDVTLGNLTVPVGTQAAIFVDGNVFISGNITYAGGATNANALPYLAIIARGNIYIGNNVTRMDGLFVAQPTGSGAADTTGIIFTCTNGIDAFFSNGNAADPNDTFAQCQNQLSINGGMIASQVKFMRMRGSLRDAASGEAPNFDTGIGTNAAEVINYTPHMWLAPSPLIKPSEDTESSTSGRGPVPLQLIKAMPPVY